MEQAILKVTRSFNGGFFKILVSSAIGLGIFGFVTCKNNGTEIANLTMTDYREGRTSLGKYIFVYSGMCMFHGVWEIIRIYRSGNK